MVVVVVVVADGVHFDSRLFLVCGWKAVVFACLRLPVSNPLGPGPTNPPLTVISTDPIGWD